MPNNRLADALTFSIEAINPQASLSHFALIGAPGDAPWGKVTVTSDLVRLSDIEADAGPAYGIVADISDLDEAIAPDDPGTEAGKIKAPSELQSLGEFELPSGRTPVVAVMGTHELSGDEGDYLNVGDSAALDLRNGTISLGFEMDELYGSMALVSKDNSGNGEGEFTIWVKNGMLQVQMEDGKGFTEWLTVPDLILAVDTTYHLAVSFGKDGLAVWVNGELAAAEPEFKIGITDNHRDLVIGASRSGVDPDDDARNEVDGTITDVMIFDKQLDQPDVVALAAAIDPALGEAGEHAMEMAALAPLFTQMHGASETLVDILADYGISEHGHMHMAPQIQTLGKAKQNIAGDAEVDAIDGGGGNDTLNGKNGDDLLQGGYGNDNLKGGKGNDILDGGHGEDTLNGGGGSDLLISRADAREPEIAFDPDRDEGDPYDELTDGKLYPDQPIPADDLLIGGGGADIFYFQTLINAKDYIIEKHTRDDGTINWHGVAGENDNLHDHWVDALGNDVIQDYSRDEGDRIVIEGHTTEISTIVYGDANGDGVMDHSIIQLYSEQGSGGGAHADDLLGTITVYGDLVRLSDIEADAGPAYGIVADISDLDEAIAPDDPGTEAGKIMAPSELQSLGEFELPSGRTPVWPSWAPTSSAATRAITSMSATARRWTCATAPSRWASRWTSWYGSMALVSKDNSGNGEGEFTIWVKNGMLQVQMEDGKGFYRMAHRARPDPGRRHHLSPGRVVRQRRPGGLGQRRAGRRRARVQDRHHRQPPRPGHRRLAQRRGPRRRRPQ